MSLAASHLEIVPAKEANLAIDKETKYASMMSGSQISYREVVSTSYSNTQASFNCNPPSPSICVDRTVLYKQPVTLTFQGTSAPGARLLQSGYDAFRSMPLHSIMNNLQLQINNSKLTVEASEVIHEMMRMHSHEDDSEEFSLSPSLPDQSQEYAELVNTNRNCLAQFGEKFGLPARGGFAYTAITNPVDGVQATVSADLCEALQISPLLFAGYRGKGLFRVQNMQVQINFDADLARLWSHAAGSGSTITSITVELGQPSLLFKYITPPATMSLPTSVGYDYRDVEVYTTELGSALAPGAQADLVSNNIQLNVVPDHLLIYAKERRGDRTFNSTDAWLPPQSLSLSWANQNGIFSGADQRELYKISKDNGVRMSFTEWSAGSTYFESGASSTEVRGTGGFMAVKMGKDVPIQDPSVATGVPGSYNLQVRMRVENRNQSRSISPALYIVPVYAGLLTIENNQTIVQNAVLSQQDVLDAAKEAEESAYVDMADASSGGSFWADVSRNLSKALPYVRKARKVGQAVTGAIPTPQAQAAKQVLDVAEAVGLGGTVIGGKSMSRRELAKLLQ